MTNTDKGNIASSILRLFVCGNAVLTWFIAIFEMRSMSALMARTSEGYMLAWALLACGIVGILDVIINDFGLLKMLRFESARTYRHFGFAGLAFCYVSQLFLAVLQLNSPSVAIYCVFNAGMIVTFSLIDANQRSKDAACVKAFN